ncbi:MAG: hypothetical protein QM790_10710 [Nibricoccus sp.]
MKIASLLLVAATAITTCYAKNPDNTGFHAQAGGVAGPNFRKVLDAVAGDATITSRDESISTVTGAVYWQFSNGIGVGADLGPIIPFTVKFWNAHYIEHTETVSATLIPVGIFARYDFFPTKSIAPFVRAGVRKTFVVGDDVTDGEPVGLFGGAGIEFMHNRTVRVGAEIGFDTTTIKVLGAQKPYYVRTKVTEVKPFAVTFSVYASF